MIADAELTPERLQTLIVELGDPERLAKMSDAAIGLGYPEAASAVADLVERYASGGSRP